MSTLEENDPQQNDPQEPSYPRTWFWGPDGTNEGDGQGDGDVCSGTYAGFDVASTRDWGRKAIVVVTVAGEQRSIWLLQTALESGFRDELQRRQGQITEGEQIVIRRLPEVRTQDGKRTYRPFKFYFPDRPATDPLEFLGIDLSKSKTKAETVAFEAAAVASGNGDGGDVDDGIPF